MSSYHEAHLPPDPNRAVVWSAIADYLSPWIPPGGAVLEIGAGYCDWINQVQANRRVAIDIWPGVTQYAAPGVVATVLDAATGLRSLGEGQFDSILASNVLEHFEAGAVATIAQDLFALLRQGGRLVIVQPNFRTSWRSYFDDYTHRSIFTDVSLPNLLRSIGFAVERVEPRFIPYSMRDSLVTPRSWLVRAYLRSPIRPRAGQMLVIARKD
jgi:SAM-dependent methyltransferase